MATAEVAKEHEPAGGGGIRPITDSEVASFQENGWAVLRGMVPPDLCQAMLERGKPLMADMMGGGNRPKTLAMDQRAAMTASAAHGQGTLTEVGQWVEWRGAVRVAQDPAFTGVALDPTMSWNMQRLLGRATPLRIMHDIFTCKLPEGRSTASDYHQDSTHFPLDRNAVTIWIALEEVTPEQGGVQFYTGSHHLGMLGRMNFVEDYPELVRLPLSPAQHLQPGDCTVHHGLTVHGAGTNGSANSRWSYLVSYFPADAIYTGAPYHDCDGFGLKVNEPIQHPSFTLVPQ